MGADANELANQDDQQRASALAALHRLSKSTDTSTAVLAILALGCLSQSAQQTAEGDMNHEGVGRRCEMVCERVASLFLALRGKLTSMCSFAGGSAVPNGSFDGTQADANRRLPHPSSCDLVAVQVRQT